MGCKIIRRKLVIIGTISFNGEPMKVKAKEWREEECGIPIFGNGQKVVCNSCLNGWVHEHNYMLDTKENNILIAQAKEYKQKN